MKALSASAPWVPPPSAGVVDEVRGRSSVHHLELVVAGALAPVAGEQAKSRVPVERPGTEGGEGTGPTVADDPGDVGHGLDVVDHGGLAEEADGGRGGLMHGEPALALERLEQRRLLAADVGTGTGMHDDVDGEARAEDVVPHRAVGVGVVQRRLQALQSEHELAAQIDEGLGDLRHE